MKTVLLDWFQDTITEITERYVSVLQTTRLGARYHVISAMIHDANQAGMNNVTVKFETESRLHWEWNNLSGMEP